VVVHGALPNARFRGDVVVNIIFTALLGRQDRSKFAFLLPAI
jgi:hypothetical protein